MLRRLLHLPRRRRWKNHKLVPLEYGLEGMIIPIESAEGAYEGGDDPNTSIELNELVAEVLREGGGRYG